MQLRSANIAFAEPGYFRDAVQGSRGKSACLPAFQSFRKLAGRRTRVGNAIALNSFYFQFLSLWDGKL